MIDVPRETAERLHRLLDLVRAEGATQNLIAPSTDADAWSRHVVDSLQLLPLAPSEGCWIDIGSGAGFPGLVIAIASTRPVHLLEPRRLRADFLARAAEATGCTNVTVHASRVEAVPNVQATVISARAVARLDKLFEMALHLARRDTVWLLPKGRRVEEELAEARRSWQGVFHVEPSVTDPESGIVVASAVARKGLR